MKLIVTMERDETGMIVVECPAIPGCVSQGKTEEEALANIREAIALCIEARLANGMPRTGATREIEVAVGCLLSLWFPVPKPSKPSPKQVGASTDNVAAMWS